MNTLFLIVALSIIVLLLGFSAKIVRKYSERPYDFMSYEDVMNIIDKNIDEQFRFKYKLEYQLKDIRILSDFEKELDTISKAVLLSFSSDFYRNIECYHSRDYIYGYVIKKTQILLIEFQNKIKIKSL